MLDPAQKQQRRNVLPVDPYAEVQARGCAVPGLDRPDELAAGNDVARVKRRRDGLVRRQHPARVRDRQHIPRHHESHEVDDPIRGRINAAACREVDPAMPGRVPGGRRDERSNDSVRAMHRPRPRRVGHGGAHGKQGENEDGAKHPLIVRRGRRTTAPDRAIWAQDPRIAHSGGAVVVFSEHS